MGKSTFEGPILSGTCRAQPYRNLGAVELVQGCDIDFTSVAPGFMYSGGSQQFVNGNILALYNNVNAPVVATTLSSGLMVANTYPNTPASIPADSATAIYRGVVMFLPPMTAINDIFIDCGVLPTVASGTITSIKAYISNSFANTAGTGSAYGCIASTGITATGRQTLDAFTSAQFTNQQQTVNDIMLPPPVGINSQFVFTIAIVGTAMTTLSAGKFFFTLRYTQADTGLGTTTLYPFGNVS